MNFYEILGVDKDASTKDIKKAFKEGVLKFHPDKQQKEGKIEIFHQLEIAYRTLTDPHLRALYDDEHKSNTRNKENPKLQLEGNEEFKAFEKQSKFTTKGAPFVYENLKNIEKTLQLPPGKLRYKEGDFCSLLHCSDIKQPIIRITTPLLLPYEGAILLFCPIHFSIHLCDNECTNDTQYCEVFALWLAQHYHRTVLRSFVVLPPPLSNYTIQPHFHISQVQSTQTTQTTYTEISSQSLINNNNINNIENKVEVGSENKTTKERSDEKEEKKEAEETIDRSLRPPASYSMALQDDEDVYGHLELIDKVRRAPHSAYNRKDITNYIYNYSFEENEKEEEKEKEVKKATDELRRDESFDDINILKDQTNLEENRKIEAKAMQKNLKKRIDPITDQSLTHPLSNVNINFGELNEKCSYEKCRSRKLDENANINHHDAISFVRIYRDIYVCKRHPIPHICTVYQCDRLLKMANEDFICWATAKNYQGLVSDLSNNTEEVKNVNLSSRKRYYAYWNDRGEKIDGVIDVPWGLNVGQPIPEIEHNPISDLAKRLIVRNDEEDGPKKRRKSIYDNVKQSGIYRDYICDLEKEKLDDVGDYDTSLSGRLDSDDVGDKEVAEEEKEEARLSFAEYQKSLRDLTDEDVKLIENSKEQFISLTN